MQCVCTGVITVSPERKMEKDRGWVGWGGWGGEGEEKDRVRMMGMLKLTIKTVTSCMSWPPLTLTHTLDAVYLPWLPVIIINMPFS